MEISEQVLWYLLDTVAVRESVMGGDTKKSGAAVELMKLLKKPSPDECQILYSSGFKVVAS